MGKGDKKSRRGKISSGTYGVRRPRKKSRTPVVANSKSKKKK
ncbi:30S ribosomal protein THX [Psychroserpens sp.]|nr:30S ribosomal protein THX [Psychroserpens sp.]MBO6606026.1 30S ribosomal protein THX [Psychroserpens sp.]MBO6630332.1 30S ribosomal protein THX [Psychroserpens sp.]MBO6652603.1 30S ribosomal protein THX [Psychroserpens sp.]MBO6681625.1 30S ribosomal protein THX [Psychroserpens sp.]MBO6749400.1 30S ribosomal protein THX [Psychroserpens sp.]